MKNIAFFITPHGFGHATRAAAIMQAIQEDNRNIKIHIYTLAPRWIFEETLQGNFEYHPLLTDVGFVQHSPLKENIDETVQKLSNLYPFESGYLETIAEELKQNEVSVVISDIAPVGILAAEAASIPSVLIENFTWDWIYQEYINDDPRFTKYINILHSYFKKATFHIQTQPICLSDPTRNLLTNPVSRNSRIPRDILRNKMGIPEDRTVILLTISNLDDGIIHKVAPKSSNLTVIIPGNYEKLTEENGWMYLPNHNQYFHPDLIQASDIVIGKMGYSTLAEIFYAPTRFLYISRPRFPESIPLSEFTKRNITSLEMKFDDLVSGEWESYLSQLLKQPVTDHSHLVNGSKQISKFFSMNNFI